MPQFIVNRNAYRNTNGIGYAHEVHNISIITDCLPETHNWIALGDHPNCFSAITKANEILTGLSPYQADGCAHCTPLCHTR